MLTDKARENRQIDPTLPMYELTLQELCNVYTLRGGLLVVLLDALSMKRTEEDADLLPSNLRKFQNRKPAKGHNPPEALQGKVLLGGVLRGLRGLFKVRGMFRGFFPVGTNSGTVGLT